uniref:G-protein coupled receptors family 1 profile domain-containing protein n=1 Tax=Strongyloides stercoralis TaxID=6248 RepID=A0A0K0ENM4_STRER
MTDELLFHKIINVLPFLNLHISLINIIINIIVSIIGYGSHVLVIISIFKLRKTSQTFREPFFTIMIILSFIEMIGHFTQYTLLHFFRFDPLIEYFLQNSPPPILFTIIFDILGCSFVAQGCYYLLIAIMRYIAITFTTEACIVSL